VNKKDKAKSPTPTSFDTYKEDLQGLNDLVGLHLAGQEKEVGESPKN
jgi:hypothetical protein|tara:strand:- start:4182 stop:4322 length:141 start_codon:yes stop_codon:yes gene_type:complete